MDRFTPLDQLVLSAEQQSVVDQVRHGRRGTVPANVVAWLANPELARRAAHLGELLRYQTSLPPRLSELAILVVARRWACAYEWAIHAPEAARAGLHADVIDAIGAGRTPPLGDPRDQAVHAFAHELVTAGRVSEACFARASDAVGELGVTDLIGVVGYYTLVAFTLNVREVSTPAGAPELPNAAES